MSITPIFAQVTADAAWWDTSIGKVLGALLAGVGIIVCIAAAVKAVGKFSAGRVGEGIRVIIGALLIAALLFRPTLLSTIIGTFSDIFEDLFNSTDSIVDTSTTTGYKDF